MSVERESLSELQNQRVGLETKLSRAQKFYEDSGSLDFRIKDRLILDPQDPNYAERAIKLGAARRRFRESVVPTFQSELYGVEERINDFTINETLARKRTQLERMQELVASGDLTEEHTKPITDEIAELEAKKGIIRFGPPNILVQEPEVTAPSATPEVSEESERDRQIKLIRRNLGNPNAFEFDEEASLNEIFVYAGLRAYNALMRNDVNSIEKLLSLHEDEILGLRQFGPKSLDEVYEVLIQNKILPKTSDGSDKIEPAHIEPDESQTSNIADVGSQVIERKLGPRPDLIINLETRAIRIGGDEWITISDDLDWEVFRFFAQNPRRKVWLGEQQLRRIANSAGYRVVRGQEQALKTSVQYLARALRHDSKTLLTSGNKGQSKSYTLNVGRVNLLGSESQSSQMGYNVNIPGGILVRTGGMLEAQALRAVITSNSNNFDEVRLSRILFGSEDDMSLRRTRGLIRKLNSVVLAPHKLGISLIDGKYDLVKTG